MKKLITILLALSLTAALVACKSNDPKNEEVDNKNDVVVDENEASDEGVENNENESDVTETPEFTETDLAGVADGLYNGIPADEMPMVMSMPLDAETFEYSSFIPYEEGVEAVVNEAMIGSIPHSVVLVKCADEDTAKRVGIVIPILEKRMEFREVKWTEMDKKN